MRWRLHPVHRSEDSREILQNCVARNVEELDHFVSRLARRHFETVVIDEEIQLMGSSVLLSQGAQVMLRIPLLLADVAFQRISQAPGGMSSYILGVLPHRPQGSYGMAVWFFLVGPCSKKEFQDLLWNFGRRGAVRRDVKDALCVTSTVLGAGGCGKVLLAKKLATGEHFESNSAVKELVSKGKPVDCTLRTEIEFLAAAQGHPNIAVLQGVFHHIDDDDDQEEEITFKMPGSPQLSTMGEERPRERWLIALQLYTGGDLFERVQRHGALKEPETVEVVLGLLSALAYVHHLGIIHRDVKCENILLDGNRAVLSDFGISCYMSDTERMEQRVGSPGYASPEMLKGQSYSEKIDLFATGVVLYFALTRTLPFADSSVARVLARTVRCKVRWPQEKFHQCSGGIVKLCKVLLSQDPRQRPSATTAFAAMWALLRPKERQEDSVLQSLHAMPVSSKSAPPSHAPTAASPAGGVVNQASSDRMRSPSPWRKLIDSAVPPMRQKVRTSSKEGSPDTTDYPEDEASLRSFLRKDLVDSGAPEPPCAASARPAGQSQQSGDPCQPIDAKSEPTKGISRAGKATGFVRRHLRDFFHTIQRVRGTAKVSPTQAKDHEGPLGQGVQGGMAFDALMPQGPS